MATEYIGKTLTLQHNISYRDTEYHDNPGVCSRSDSIFTGTWDGSKFNGTLSEYYYDPCRGSPGTPSVYNASFEIVCNNGVYYISLVNINGTPISFSAMNYKSPVNPYNYCNNENPNSVNYTGYVINTTSCFNINYDDYTKNTYYAESINCDGDYWTWAEQTDTIVATIM
jgi:hypothetical protein